MSSSKQDYKALLHTAALELEARVSTYALLLAITDSLIEAGIVTQASLDLKVQKFNELQFKELSNGQRVYENEEGYSHINSAPMGE